MRPERFAVWALAGLAVVLVGIGLYQVGSPGQARMDRRDEVRVRDLKALSGCISNMSDESYAALPSDLTEQLGCDRPKLMIDSVTGQPFKLERLTGRYFKVCATMERPDGPYIDSYGIGTFDRASGCLTVYKDKP